jgi:hypothetical protein
MGTLLKWPAAATGIGLDVDTFVVPVSGQPAGARVLITAEISGGDAAPAAVGYEIVDATSGKGVADAFDAPANTAEIAAGLRQYLVALPLPAGSYVLKAGAIGTDGRRGSVEHAFDVPAWPPDGLRIGDVILGDEADGAFRPIARATPAMAALVARVEIHADDADMLEGLTARLILEPAPVGPLGAPPTVTMSEVAGDPLRRVAVARWSAKDLPPGAYVVTVVIEASGREVARRSRGVTAR